MKLRKADAKRDVIYPLRIPVTVFQRAKEIAQGLDISTCQLIRALLREKIAKADNLNHIADGSKSA